MAAGCGARAMSSWDAFITGLLNVFSKKIPQV
jgi:hypothetical protein